MSKINVLYVNKAPDAITLSTKGDGPVGVYIEVPEALQTQIDAQWDAGIGGANKRAAKILADAAKGTDAEKAAAQKSADAVIASRKAICDANWNAAILSHVLSEAQAASQRETKTDAQVKAEADALLSAGLDSGSIA